MTDDQGLDPHRDDWMPTPFLLKVYDRAARTYVMEFEVPKQLLLQENWEALVHDEVLRYGHRDGLVLEGQVAITAREKEQAPPDGTTERDASVREVLLDEDKEEQAAVEQDAVEFPFMSQKEIEFRRRMRADLRQTAQEALGFVQRHLDGRPVPGDEREFKINPQAFMEGFFGGTPQPVSSADVMVVHCEAFVASDLGLLSDDDQRWKEHIEAQVTDVEIPDDLSGLDG